jgi:hypothetical protein
MSVTLGGLDPLFLTAKKAREVTNQMICEHHRDVLRPILERIRAEVFYRGVFLNFAAAELPSEIRQVLEAQLGYRVVDIDAVTVRVSW